MQKYKDSTGGFSCAGEFYAAVKKAGVEGIVNSRLIQRKPAGRLTTAEDSQGGFLVPETWADGIFHLALEDSIVRSRATVLPCPSDSLKIRTIIDSDRSSSIFGGITFTWKSEAQSKVGGISKPAVGLLELTPHKYVGSTWVSNELEDDHGAFGTVMEISFGQAIRFLEDDFFIWGTGAGQPRGIMTVPGLMIQIPRAGIGALVWADFAGLASRLLPDSWNRAVWLINPLALDDLMNLTAPAANQVPVLDLGRMTLLNRPIIVTSHCSQMGVQGDVILADFGAGHYVIADKELEISASRHVPGESGFRSDETYWRVVLRTDGQTVVQNPITPLRGGATVSPFVSLTTSS